MMDPNKARDIFPIFLAIWFVLGIASTCYFLFNNNTAQKRKVLPYFIIGAGGIFLSFVAYEIPAGLVVMVPAVIFFSYLNLRMTKFCDACGKTLFNQNPFSPPQYCSKCGEKLMD